MPEIDDYSFPLEEEPIEEDELFEEEEGGDELNGEWPSHVYGNMDPSTIVELRNMSEYWYLNFLLWAQYCGAEVDSKPFSLDGHAYIIPMYMDRSVRIVVQKAAQMGLTIFMSLRKFHMALYPAGWGFSTPIKVGFYFPDKSGITDMVSDRFEPMMSSCPDLMPYSKQSKKLLKRVGRSSIYYRYMEGKSSKDSAPLNALFFDEVRLMKNSDIEQATERLSGSKINYIFAASTAGYPECFSGDTVVWARRVGHPDKIQAKSISSFMESGYTGWQVISLDQHLQRFVWKNVIAAKSSGIANTIQIVMTNGKTITCTPEHPFAQMQDGVGFGFEPIQYGPACKVEHLVRVNCGTLYAEPYTPASQLVSKTTSFHIVPGERQEVFDIQVEGEPCFVLAETGILTHNSDINLMFLDSDQKWFHTICERCGYEQCLPDDFPNCIAEHTIGPRRGQTYYICKHCKDSIPDTQNGLFVPHGDPTHEVSGYQISQLISHEITAKKVIETFRNSENVKEFYNAKLGIPYVDEENRPVTLDALIDNSYKNLHPLMEWGQSSGRCYMGVDQMMNLNYAFVLESRGGERRIVWFEIIEDDDPFERCAELMEDYAIHLCVADAEPNTNDALRFARRFNRRVFLAKKGSYEHTVRWDDHWRPKRPQRRAANEEYYQYRVFLDTYQSIGRTLDWIKEGKLRWPNPDKLIASATPLGGGTPMPCNILKSHAFPHFACPVREKEILDADEQRYRFRWKLLGYDPHSLDALNYALTASLRKNV